jgi:hypothetical protein
VLRQGAMLDDLQNALLQLASIDLPHERFA